MIDLRSDTVTRPTAGMRRAIAEAEVGDDALGDDPTVHRLEHRIAELLGKEAALFVPSGIMANQTALHLVAERGTEVVVEANAHVLDWELGGAAVNAGVQLRAVPTTDGVLTATLVEQYIRPALKYQVRTTAIALENTHNGAGGRIMPLTEMQAIRDVARARKLRVHLDGARLWNASVATGVPESEYAQCADTVMVTLSKGLGCPVGSMIAGTRDDMEIARNIRRRLGGTMRQAGILAAAGLYALEHHRERLAEDHQHATLLARLASKLEGVRVVEPETNIVMLDVANAEDVVRKLKERGVLMTVFTPTRVRAVTHLDVDIVAIETAAEELKKAVK
ncbi:MAG: threonine aldolase family protein [Gemmatimonadota bacterium]